MGRRVKYSTKAERKEAQKRWSREYYYRNRAVLQAKARERYRKKKEIWPYVLQIWRNILDIDIIDIRTDTDISACI